MADIETTLPYIVFGLLVVALLLSVRLFVLLAWHARRKIDTQRVLGRR